MIFSDLPTVVRRVFDEYLNVYAGQNPGAVFAISGDPTLGATGYSIPFSDRTTGTEYVVLIAESGEVIVTKATS